MGGARNGKEREGDVKGTVLQSRLAFVRHRLGDGGLERVLSRLPPDDRARLSGTVMPMAWYPFSLNDRLDRAIGAELGRGDLTFHELGARSAFDNLGETHRVYVRQRDPHGLLKNTARIYGLYYNTGYRTYEWVSRTKAVLRTFDSRSYSIPDCLTVVGWHQKAVEMCGGTNVRVVEVSCRAQDAPICEYVCEWK